MTDTGTLDGGTCPDCPHGPHPGELCHHRYGTEPNTIMCSCRATTPDVILDAFATIGVFDPPPPPRPI